MHLFAAAVSVLAVAAACGSSKSPNSAATPAATPARTLRISSIPDQDPAKLAARDGAMAAALSAKLGVRVEYVPVTDYAASVSLFKTGDLDLVFYGGLTGVQARLQTPGATLLAQRDIDDAFQTVFIANAKSALKPITDVKGLSEYKGTRFTFGSETSTSGRLMPEFFLDQAGVSENDFKGPGGFSGSHDKTIDLVQAGTYDGGALNVQVWNTRKQKGTVDLTKVTEIFTTPSYHDYHWLAGPKTNERFGAGFTDKVKAALLGMAYTNPDDAKVLDLYGAKKFIATQASNYDQVEAIGRKLHLIT
jgi:phosphonate transport system substrate-binding protein